MNLNVGTIIGAIIGGPIGYLVAGADVEQKTHFSGMGVVIGAIVGTLIWKMLRKDKPEKPSSGSGSSTSNTK
jgi:chromate transport protein ChrA